MVLVRAIDLEPGRRVRLPRSSELVVVVDVTEDEYHTCIVHTELGAYPCNRNTLISAEDATASVRGIG